jgi:carboxymethylenebutenolidase
MASLAKKYEPVVYPGAEHMFVRLGEMPGNRNPANLEARNLSMARLQQLLKTM